MDDEMLETLPKQHVARFCSFNFPLFLVSRPWGLSIRQAFAAVWPELIP